jgi:fused-like protein
MGADTDARESLEYVDFSGSAFGLSALGALDACAHIMDVIVVNGGSIAFAALFSATTATESAWELLSKRIESLSISNTLSMRGLQHALSCILHALKSNSLATTVPKCLNDALVMGLVALLRESKLKRIVDWPARAPFEGGLVCVSTLVPAVCSILNLPLAQLGQASNEDSEVGGSAEAPIDEDTLSRLQSVIYNQLCVRHAITAFPLLLDASQQQFSHQHSAQHYMALKTRALGAPATLLARLVIGSNYFVAQLIQFGGLTAIPKCRLLTGGENMPASVLVDTLQMLSQVARASKDNYAPIAAQCGTTEADDYLFEALAGLLKHSEASVRAKAANLVGNLARHSAQFYPQLRRCNVLAPLLDCCRDQHHATRKFACFAVGNAAFHSDTLYVPELRVGIPALVALLGDNDEKTRANAAGALGNLARNSDACVDALCAARAPETLVAMVIDPSSQQQPRKIALFSLGNLCNFAPCRQALRTLQCVGALQKLSQTETDSHVQKWLARIIKHIQP